MNKTWPGWIQIWPKHRIYLPYSSRNCFESFKYSEKRIASIHENFITCTCIHRFSTRKRIPPPLVFHCPFSTVECSVGYNQYYSSLLECNFESAAKPQYKTRWGLGRVCVTGMYRSIEQVKFPKFQTRIFGEWKTPIHNAHANSYLYIWAIRFFS